MNHNRPSADPRAAAEPGAAPRPVVPTQRVAPLGARTPHPASIGPAAAPGLPHQPNPSWAGAPHPPYVPPGQGVARGYGVPPGQGVARGHGVPPGQGVPPGLIPRPREPHPGWSVAGPVAPPRRSGGIRALVWVSLGVVVLLVAGAVGLFVATAKAEPAEVVAQIAEEMRGWDGMAIQGNSSGSSLGSFGINLTIDRAGNGKGDVTVGATRMEIGLVGDQVLVKTAALGNGWLRGQTVSGTPGLNQVVHDPPARYADRLAAVVGWTEQPERTVDGQRLRVFSTDSFGTVLVADGRRPRLVSVENNPTGGMNFAARISPASPDTLAEIGALVPQVNSAPSVMSRLPGYGYPRSPYGGSPYGSSPEVPSTPSQRPPGTKPA